MQTDRELSNRRFALEQAVKLGPNRGDSKVTDVAEEFYTFLSHPHDKEEPKPAIGFTASTPELEA